MKMFSLDPFRILEADEFAAWVLLTLFICFLYYAYSLVKSSISKRLLRSRKGFLVFNFSKKRAERGKEQPKALSSS